MKTYKCPLCSSVLSEDRYLKVVDEFKSMANDTIYRARLLGEILAKEMKSHMGMWHDRFDNYKNIHSNINILEGNTKAILKGEKPQKIQKDELLRLPFSVEIVKKGLDK